MEQDIFDQEVKLLDGSSRKVFSKKCVDGTFYYNCNVCRVAGLPGVNNFLIHVNGKKHKRNTLKPQTPERFDLPFKSYEYVDIPSNELTVPRIVIEKPFIASKNINEPSTSSSADILESKTRQLSKSLKSQLETQIADISSNYEKYRIEPESHPSYKEEWEKFWVDRNKKLKSDGVADADKYDHRPEWVKFFPARLIELEREEIQKIENISKKRSPKRSPSPVEELQSSSDEEFCDDRTFKTKKFKSSGYHSRSSHRSSSRRDELKSQISFLETIREEPVTVINACRLLLALESDLGLIAKNIVQLLSSALTCEARETDSSDKVILQDFENLVLLQTVKEKLRGLLTLNLLEPKKMLIVKKSIQNIAILVHKANSEPQEIEPNAELATKISKALVLSGKEDFTEEELEGLTTRYIQKDQPMEVEQKPATPRTTTSVKESSSIDGLTDDELKTLLHHFTELTESEQGQIIRFLSSLEKNDPSKADEFRNFMKSDDSQISKMMQDVYDIDEMSTTK